MDEEAILSLLENSQTFLPPSQTSSHSPLLGTCPTLILKHHLSDTLFDLSWWKRNSDFFSPSPLSDFITPQLHLISVTSLFSLIYADGSPDHALIDLLAGLEDDGFRRTPVRQNSQSQSLHGARNYHCNSDEEEAEPEHDREEAELSVIMSQRWDREPPESLSLQRWVKNTNWKSQIELYCYYSLNSNPMISDQLPLCKAVWKLKHIGNKSGT